MCQSGQLREETKVQDDPAEAAPVQSTKAGQGKFSTKYVRQLCGLWLRNVRCFRKNTAKGLN